MDEEERAEAVEVVTIAIEKFPTDPEKASKFIKDDMDKKFGQYFHCSVGKAFGYCCEFEIKHKLVLCFGPIGVLLYKCKYYLKNNCVFLHI